MALSNLLLCTIFVVYCVHQSEQQFRCPEGQYYRRSSYSCVNRCRGGRIYDPTLKTCILKCGENALYDVPSSSCKCYENHVGDPRTKCSPCGINAHYSEKEGYGWCYCDQGFEGDELKVCTPICKQGAYFDWNSKQYKQCRCIKGYFPLNNDVSQGCIKCGAQAGFDDRSGHCVCNANCTGDPLKFCTPTCGRNAYYNFLTKQCECLHNYHGKPGISHGCVRCGANSVFQGGRCVCKQGCNGDPTKACHYICGPNAYYKAHENRCVCNSGFHGNAEDLTRGCIRCGPNGRYVAGPGAETGKCLCRNKYHGDANEVCDGVCGPNEYFCYESETCKCLPGYYHADEPGLKGCIGCGSNAKFDPKLQKCVCDTDCKGDPYRKCDRLCGRNAFYDHHQSGCRCHNGYFGNPNNGYGCTRCGINAHWDAVTNRCVCNEGCSGDGNSVCNYDCGVNAFYDYSQGLCRCQKDFYGNPNKNHGCTRCGINAHWDAVTNRCVCNEGCSGDGNSVCNYDCGPNAFYDYSQGRCQCQKGFYGNPNKNHGCTRCGINAHWDALTNRCVCNEGCSGDGNSLCNYDCGPNAFYDYSQGRCQCQKEYHGNPNKNHGCTICGTNAHWDPIANKCVCNKGCSGDGNKECNYDCQKYAEYDYNLKKCICSPGYHNIGGSCVKCGSLAHYENGQCVCDTGCSGDALKGCSYTCGKLAYYDFKQKKCVCFKDCNGDPVKGCIRCGANSVFNERAYKCECINGYAPDPYGYCSVKCGNYQFFDYKLQRCVCLDGYSPDVNGVCIRCGPNAHYDSVQKTCVCRSSCSGDAFKGCTPKCGPYAYYDHNTHKCTCYRNCHGADPEKGCRKCGLNASWDGTKCVCNSECGGDPYSICKPHCFDNAWFNYWTNKCECKPGYKLDNTGSLCL